MLKPIASFAGSHAMYAGLLVAVHAGQTLILGECSPMKVLKATESWLAAKMMPGDDPYVWFYEWQPGEYGMRATLPREGKLIIVSWVNAS